ncbi:MAG: 30S ribosomal protein S14 [Planctomycetes bacterium]|nr:30S ribosomal protein S14 [Planctomycetota bacterium]
MACKSTVERMKRVEATVAKYAERRRAMKEAGDYAGLTKLPRDASPTRIRNLCALTGRSRAVYSKFKLCRIKLRELALEGKVPGMRKASW